MRPTRFGAASAAALLLFADLFSTSVTATGSGLVDSHLESHHARHNENARAGPSSMHKRQGGAERAAARRNRIESRQAAALVERQQATGQSPSNDQQAAVVNMAASDPIQAAQMALQLPGLTPAGNQPYKQYTLIPSSSTGGIQLPVNDAIPYIAETITASLNSATSSWITIPTGFQNFVLNRTVFTTGATMPYYINSGFDPKNIKKTIIVWPGKPRDSWAYTNYVQNALNVLVNRNTNPDININSVLIIGPAWLNDDDKASGSANPTDIVFHGSQWNHGGNSRFPLLEHKLTSYEVLDYFLDWVFDNATFPNMKNAVVMGHSMGAQATQRYALLKKSRWYDDNVKFWIGNPGSYAWPVDSRPNTNASCTTGNEWHYGLRGNQTQISKYARDDVIINHDFVVNRFRSRKIHYAYGLLDNGLGDTHCEAGLQGTSHLDRGAQFVQMLGAMPGGFPTTHTVDFMANTSHQDYAMISADTSIKRIFIDDWDVRFPDITNTTNPSDKPEVVQKPRVFATRGNVVLATSLLGGSVGACLLAFMVLPFMFPGSSFSPVNEGEFNDFKYKNS